MKRIADRAAMTENHLPRAPRADPAVPPADRDHHRLLPDLHHHRCGRRSRNVDDRPHRGAGPPPRAHGCDGHPVDPADPSARAAPARGRASAAAPVVLHPRRRAVRRPAGHAGHHLREFRHGNVVQLLDRRCAAQRPGPRHLLLQRAPGEPRIVHGRSPCPDPPRPVRPRLPSARGRECSR